MSSRVERSRLLFRIATVPILASLFLGVPTCWSVAQETSDKYRSANKITSKKKFQVILDDLQQCPADLSPKHTVRYVSKTKICRANLSACFDQCINAGDANHCFALALFLQENESLDKKYAESLFARACANGLAGACTNRSAGLMNTNNANKDAKLPSGENIRECVARSFKETCGAQDPWGCTMLGVVYLEGAGVKKDAKRAEESLRKTCELSPNSEPCRYAMSVLQKLGAKP